MTPDKDTDDLLVTYLMQAAKQRLELQAANEALAATRDELARAYDLIGKLHDHASGLAEDYRSVSAKLAAIQARLDREDIKI